MTRLLGILCRWVVPAHLDGKELLFAKESAPLGMLSLGPGARRFGVKLLRSGEQADPWREAGRRLRRPRAGPRSFRLLLTVAGTRV